MNLDTDKVLKEIWRGEKAATETYEQALEKLGTEPGSDVIREMKRDHFEALQTLQEHFSADIKDDSDSSGAWGAWAQTVMGTAKLFGDKSALKALKEGEEHGLKQYHDVLDKKVDPRLKDIIKNRFIPRQQEHIRNIDRLMDRVAS